MGAQDWGSKPPKVQGLSPAATVSLDPRIAPIFKISPDQATTINATSGGKPDETLTIMVDSVGVSSFNVTFGTNFRSTAVLATGTADARRFNVSFKSDGIVWSEISRTAAQA
jgi:hypothetical protein